VLNLFVRNLKVVPKIINKFNNKMIIIPQPKYGGVEIRIGSKERIYKNIHIIYSNMMTYII
jgi:hypothetical protein